MLVLYTRDFEPIEFLALRSNEIVSGEFRSEVNDDSEVI